MLNFKSKHGMKESILDNNFNIILSTVMILFLVHIVCWELITNVRHPAHAQNLKLCSGGVIKIDLAKEKIIFKF